ncbi:MAG: hypothetical protein AAFY58_01845, partial [Planctomycetota bacterium]
MPSDPSEPNRVELDPAESISSIGDAEESAPPERREQQRVDDPDVQSAINELIDRVGGESGSFDGRLMREMVTASLKLVPDGRATGELKLMTAAVKELRY